MKKTKLLLLFLFTFLPGIAFAETNAWNWNLREFVTHNGFDSVVTAFQFIARIFSDKRYEITFEAVFIIGFLAAIIMAGKYRTELLWFMARIFIGACLYLSFIAPKGTVHVYDTVTNQYQAVGGVPEGIIFVAGFFNKIENGLIDIIETAGDPVSYTNQAGGFGFDVVRKLLSDKFQLEDQYIHVSIQRYFEDCVYFEMQRPGSTLSLNDFYNSSDFIPLFAKGDNPAIYTVWWDENNKQGTTMTCYEAWHNHLKPWLDNLTDASATIINIWTGACGKAGVDTSDPNQVTQCRDKTVNLVNAILGSSFSSPQLIKQYLLASEMNDVIARGGTEAVATLANRNTGISLTGIGINFNEWMPTARGALIATAILLLPILALLLPTPIWGKVTTTVVGMFIWLTAWGVADAGLHQMCIHKINHLFAEIKLHGLGLNSILTFSDEASKGLAFFGGFRAAGLMLASVISSMLVGFGGSALAHLVGGTMASIKSAGMDAAMKTQTPEGSARELQALELSGPTHAWVNAEPFWRREAIATMDKLTKGKAGAATLDWAGGGSADVASDLLAKGRFGRTVESTATGIGGGNAVLQQGFNRSVGAIQNKQLQSLEKYADVANPILSGQREAAGINAQTDNWASLVSGIAGRPYGELTNYERSSIQAIDDVVGREFKGDISQITSKAVSTAARDIRQHALSQAEKYADLDSGSIAHALNSTRELMHSKTWNEKKGTSENWKTVEDITKKFDSYYNKTRKLGISDQKATEALLYFMGRGSASIKGGLEILGSGVGTKVEGLLEGRKSFKHGTTQTHAIEDAAKIGMSLAKTLKNEHVLDAFKQAALSTNDTETFKNLANIHSSLQEVLSHSKEIGEEFRQAEALEKMSKNEEALKQSLGVDPRHLFERALIENHGIEGTKERLQKAQYDKQTRMDVLSEYQQFVAGLVKENAGTLAENLNRAGYKAPEKTTIKKPTGGITKDEITKGLADIRSRVQSFGPPEGYGVIKGRAKENLMRLEQQKAYWEKIKQAKSDYIMKYGPAKFYAATGTRATDWDRWEKEVNEYFAHGSFINAVDLADRVLNKGDYLLGKLGEKVGGAMKDIGKLYLEGAKRFPNEDAPHSMVDKNLESVGPVAGVVGKTGEMVAKGVSKGIETGIEAGRLYKEGASRFPNETEPHSMVDKNLESVEPIAKGIGKAGELMARGAGDVGEAVAKRVEPIARAVGKGGEEIAGSADTAIKATGKAGKAVAKAIGSGIEAGKDISKLYLEGASRFPNEDAPHSEAGKQLEEMGKK